MMLTDVCRLCLAKDNLVWIFDKRFENSQNMKDVIFTTTGVEIHMKDVISQKICKKCCEIAVKMLQFRTKSLENNMYLKELFKECLKNGKFKIPNTNVTIKSEKNETKKEDKPIVPKSSYKVHTSVQSLFKVYPQIKIPNKCLEFHIDPHVFMTMDSVENYFIERKIDMNKHIQLALRGNREPKKHRINEDETTGKEKGGSHKQTDIRPEKLNQDTTKINDSDGISYKSNVESNKDGAKVKLINIKNNTDNSICKIMENNIVQDDTGVHKTDMLKPTVKTAKSSHSEQKENISKIEKLQGSKRKLSETEPVEVKKPTFIKSLELIQKTNDTAETMYVDKSVPLYICDICNSVQYNAKDLKRHQLKHLRCQFCKAKFRTMEYKTQHLASSCPIKNIMNNLPTVLLEKIEMDRESRIKYRDAFVDFPPLPGIALVTNQTDINDNESLKSKLNEKSQKSTRKTIKHITVDNSSMEVIEILSDDDIEEIDPNNSKAKKAKTLGTTVDAPANSPVTPASTTPSTDTNSHVPLLSTILTNHTNFSITSVNAVTTHTMTPVPSASPVLLNSNENIVYNTVSLVKPDIKIKNNSILDKFDSKDSDIKVMKELLTVEKIVNSTKDVFVQTDSPSNERIVISKVDFTCDLLFLKHQLHMYTIPVKVKNGHYHVSYKYERPPKKLKKMCLWNDLIPTEIKITKNTPLTSSASNIQTDVNNSAYKTTAISSGVPKNYAAIGSNIPPVNSNSAVPVITTMTNMTVPQIHNVTSAVPKNIPKKVKSSPLIELPYGSPIQNARSTALSISAPSTMKIPDRSGQHASSTVKMYQNKMLTPASSVNSSSSTMNIGLRPGQNISGITANHQNNLLVPVTSVVPTVVLNGTLKQNMNIFTTPGHNNHQNIMSPVSSVSTPLSGNVRAETNMAVTYESNSYNCHYTTPITTSAPIPNYSNNLPPAPVNNIITHSNPKVLSESSNTSNIPTNLPNASNILNNYICNPNVPGHGSNSLVTNDVNPKPGAIRVKNVWELK